jgi:intracellular sulfur oxidation DsrE/DsrF family protein
MPSSLGSKADNQMKFLSLASIVAVLFSMTASATDYPAPQAPAVPAGTGYVEIPGAGVAIDPKHGYKVIVDGLNAAAKPTDIIPALGRASLIVNALAVAHVPAANRKIVLVFHGPSVDGLLRNDAYRKQFGVDNPNLKVIEQLAAAGVELFVCGQHMANHKLGMDLMAPGVKLSTAASIVLITYQNEGYAVLADR